VSEFQQNYRRNPFHFKSLAKRFTAIFQALFGKNKMEIEINEVVISRIEALFRPLVNDFRKQILSLTLSKFPDLIDRLEDSNFEQKFVDALNSCITDAKVCLRDPSPDQIEKKVSEFLLNVTKIVAAHRREQIAAGIKSERSTLVQSFLNLRVEVANLKAPEIEPLKQILLEWLKNKNFLKTPCLHLAHASLEPNYEPLHRSECARIEYLIEELRWTLHNLNQINEFSEDSSKYLGIAISQICTINSTSSLENQISEINEILRESFKELRSKNILSSRAYLKKTSVYNRN
jgi:hypothetical protein